MRRLAGLAGWIVLLAAVIAGFTLLGGGELATPPVTDPAAWPGWAAQRPPIVAVFAVLRLGVLAVAWYLLGVSLIGVAARLLALGRLVRVADVVTVPAVRHLLQAALGLGLATASVTASTAGSGPPVAVAVAAEQQVALAGSGPRLEMRALDDVARYEVMAPLPPGLRGWAQEAAPDPAPAVRTWEVRPGEHLWGIAEQVLAEGRDAPPSDDEVGDYWEVLVDANRGALADPDNPDLVYPGQVFTVPAPPAT